MKVHHTPQGNKVSVCDSQITYLASCALLPTTQSPKPRTVHVCRPARDGVRPVHICSSKQTKGEKGGRRQWLAALYSAVLQ